jgi:hypothetical protein
MRIFFTTFTLFSLLMVLTLACGVTASADDLTMEEGANIDLLVTKTGNSSTLTISSTDTDEKVKVSDTDTAGFLENQIVSGSGITVTSDGAEITITASDKLTTKGDVLIHNGTTETRLAVGVSGQILTSDTSSNLLWANPPEGDQLFNSNVLLNAYRTAGNVSPPQVLKMIDGAVDAFYSETGVDATASTNEIFDSSRNLYRATVDGGAELLDDNMSSLTNWTEAKISTGSSAQTTFQSESVFKFDTGSGTTGVFVSRTQSAINSGSIPNQFNVTIRTFFDSLEPISLGQSFDLRLFEGAIVFQAIFNSDGLFILNSAIVKIEAGDNLVETGKWQEWTFVVDASDPTPSNATVDIYLDGSLEASGIDCGLSHTGNEGDLRLRMNSVQTANNVGYVDFVKVGTSTAEFNNLTLISNSQTAKTEPNGANTLLLAEDVNADITLNTDVKASVSRDGGTTYTQVTLSDAGEFEKGNLLTGTADLSSQPTGTNMEWKVETLNNKALNLHGVGLEWR